MWFHVMLHEMPCGAMCCSMWLHVIPCNVAFVSMWCHVMFHMNPCDSMCCCMWCHVISCNVACGLMWFHVMFILCSYDLHLIFICFSHYGRMIFIWISFDFHMCSYARIYFSDICSCFVWVSVLFCEPFIVLYVAVPRSRIYPTLCLWSNLSHVLKRSYAWPQCGHKQSLPMSSLSVAAEPRSTCLTSGVITLCKEFRASFSSPKLPGFCAHDHLDVVSVSIAPVLCF